MKQVENMILEHVWMFTVTEDERKGYVVLIVDGVVVSAHCFPAFPPYETVLLLSWYLYDS